MRWKGGALKRNPSPCIQYTVSGGKTHHITKVKMVGFQFTLTLNYERLNMLFMIKSLQYILVVILM